MLGRVTGRPIDSLRLDLRSDGLTVDSVRTTAGRIGTLGGEDALAFRHAEDVLTVGLPDRADPGDAIDLEVYYRADPPTETGGFVDPLTFDETDTEPRRPVAWTLSEPYGARTWWPGKDHPSDKADSARVTVTVPEPMSVASNGLLERAATVDGRSTFSWFSRYPIAPYLISFAAGRYEVSEQTYVRPDSLAAEWGALELPIVHYTYPENSFLQGFERVVGMMPVMEYWFGPYPFPEEKYGHAQFTWGGGMEHQTMSSMGGSYRALVAHELAHMWFGDAVTLRRWPHLWLNEGFATYAELLFWEARREEFPGEYERVFESYWSRARRARGPLVVRDTASVGNLFSGNRVYAKGAMVLHMLRHVVGRSTFRTILRTYAQDPDLRYGTAISADFREVAERVSGRNLGYFFDQWLRRPGHPDFEVRWTDRTEPFGPPRARVVIRQEQVEAPFRMPVELEFELDGAPADQGPAATVRRRVRVEGRADTVDVELPAPATRLRFDPDRDLLRGDSVPVRRVDRLPGAPPSRLRIDGPYPNPAGSVARLVVALPESGPVEIALFDALGRRLRTVLSAELEPGEHPVTIALRELPPGSYFLRLRAGGEEHVRTLSHLE